MYAGIQFPESGDWKRLAKESQQTWMDHPMTICQDRSL